MLIRKRKHTLLSLFLLIPLLVSCEVVFEDTGYCPEDTGVTLRLSYTVNGQPTVTLPIERADFYIFDEQNRYVTTITDTDGPFLPEREYVVPLPAGNYTVLSWANLHADLALSHDRLVPGVTRLDEAHIRLAAYQLSGTRADRLQIARGSEKNLYHGMKTNIQVHEGLSTREILPLKRNTKEINLAVRYRLADGTPCDDASHQNDPWIRTADGVLSFDNSYLPSEDFLLESTTRDNSISGGYNATFRKMTLRVNEPVEPELLLTLPGDPEQVIYRSGLMEWLRGTGYDTQEKLDNTHEYNVELFFTCPHGSDGTYTGVRIFVNGWEYIPMNDEL